VSRRLVAVLGYSDGGEGLHPVCAARLERAADVARAEDLVLFSGSAKGRRRASEAELMARAWRGASDALLLDETARSTLDNVVAATRAALALEVSELVLVTSGWHARRARALGRAAARGTDVRVEVAASADACSLRARLRELVCTALLPLQQVVAARSR
jgi:vancomycin permeability regulator SanA